MTETCKICKTKSFVYLFPTLCLILKHVLDILPYMTNTKRTIIENDNNFCLNLGFALLILQVTHSLERFSNVMLRPQDKNCKP